MGPSMSTLLQYPHSEPRRGGTARIDGTRYKVIHLAGSITTTAGPPRRSSASTPTCGPSRSMPRWTYFYNHRDRLVQEMQDTATSAEREAAEQPISRAELLRRRAARES